MNDNAMIVGAALGAMLILAGLSVLLDSGILAAIAERIRGRRK